MSRRRRGVKDDVKSRGKVMSSKPSRFRPRCELCFVRILAKRFPNAEVTGITLSPEQAEFTWKRFQRMIPPLAFGCLQGSTGWSTSRGGWPDEREIPGHGCSQYGAGGLRSFNDHICKQFDLLKQMFLHEVCPRFV